MPEDSSTALLNNIPSVSNKKVTLILGIPAGFGSKPERINSPKRLLFEVVSLSPCTIVIFIEVCPFSFVVKDLFHYTR